MEITKKRKKARFGRSNYGRTTRKRVKEGWKRPRGVDSKKRMKRKGFGSEPNIGWGSPKDDRGKHPLGSYEVLVRNLEELRGAKGRLVRIAAGVGKRKKALLLQKAAELKLTVLNR
jgi:large subunit ribosomal protein L32e